MAIELYPHNQKTYERMTEMFTSSTRVGVVQPTGTGKSFLYLKWIEDYPQDTFTVLSPSTEIFTQLQEYAEASGTPNLLKRVQMISYQALLKMSDEEVQTIHPDKMVLDEFHRTGAELWGPSLQRLLDANPKTLVLGASATPVRYLDDCKDMASVLFDRNLAVEMTLGEAVRRNILPTPQYVPVWYDIDDKLGRYERDIARIDNSQKRRELEEKLEQLKRKLENAYGAEDIFQKYMPHDHGKFIVFCRDCAHLEAMKDTMRNWLSGSNANVRSYVSISAHEDKDVQLQAFKEDNGKDAIKLLFTIDRLNEGVHVKGIDGVIMLRPTTSPIVYLQQMGRALAAGGLTPLIFDMVNNYQNVQVPTKDGFSANVFEKEIHDSMESKMDDVYFHIFEDMITFSSLFADLEQRLYLSFEDRWQVYLEFYKAYKTEFGCEPKSCELYRGFEVGMWVCEQRKVFKKGSLSASRQQKLLDAGFIFDFREASWQNNCELYRVFKAKFDREPRDGEVYNGVNLRNWVHVQRANFIKGTISKEHIKKLLDIGFVFDPSESRWQEYYKLYKAYKEEFGQEPLQGEVFCGVKLGQWVSAQRTALKKGRLSEERQQKLLDAGFILDPLEATWQNNYELYKAYVAEFGQAPQYGECYRGVVLSAWARTQREAFKNRTISKERKEKLLDIGFVFDPYESRWQETYKLYKAYKDEFDREPIWNEVYHGVNLSQWLNGQRRSFKKGSLSEDRKNKLLEAGFDFKSGS